MKQGKLIYRASVDGDLTVEQQITDAEIELRHGHPVSQSRKFQISLRYDITRTIINILSNSTIKYGGTITPLCDSLQRNLKDIFFKMHDFGYCFLQIDETGRIVKVDEMKGTVKLVDPAYEITGYTQKVAAFKALEMYGVITDSIFSVIDERGVMGMFSPQKDTVVKPGAATKLYDAFKNLFGNKRGQRKFMITEVPMTYSGVSIPVKDLELLTNKKDATATIARIYGIQEDMILSGSTFDNKLNAIIQTYSDYKGLIYGWINQIESQLISFRSADNYEITFTGVPQMNIEQNKTTPQFVVPITPTSTPTPQT